MDALTDGTAAKLIQFVTELVNLTLGIHRGGLRLICLRCIGVKERRRLNDVALFPRRSVESSAAAAAAAAAMLPTGRRLGSSRWEISFVENRSRSRAAAVITPATGRRLH